MKIFFFGLIVGFAAAMQIERARKKLARSRYRRDIRILLDIDADVVSSGLDAELQQLLAEEEKKTSMAGESENIKLKKQQLSDETREMLKYVADKYTTEQQLDRGKHGRDFWPRWGTY